MKSTALVKVVSVGAKQVPIDFPFFDFVRVSLLGDVFDLENLMSELESIKSLVNRDISRFRMNLVDFSICIKLEIQ